MSFPESSPVASLKMTSGQKRQLILLPIAHSQDAWSTITTSHSWHFKTVLFISVKKNDFFYGREFPILLTSLFALPRAATSRGFWLMYSSVAFKTLFLSSVCPHERASCALGKVALLFKEFSRRWSQVVWRMLSPLDYLWLSVRITLSDEPFQRSPGFGLNNK